MSKCSLLTVGFTTVGKKKDDYRNLYEKEPEAEQQ